MLHWVMSIEKRINNLSCNFFHNNLFLMLILRVT
nr:MAG TPA: hypothetical protein [Bacteriophage sp.]